MTASLTQPIDTRIERPSALLAWGSGLALGGAVLGAGLAASHALPVFGPAASFLGLAVGSDVARGRIPNWLTLPAVLLALAFAPLVGASAGWSASFLGLGLALALGLVPYALGGMGAGDVKAMMALGAWFGAGAFSSIAVLAIASGAGLALGALLLRGELSGYLRRWGRILYLSLASRRMHYTPPAAGSMAAHGIPFAVALAIGVALHGFTGGAW